MSIPSCGLGRDDAPITRSCVLPTGPPQRLLYTPAEVEQLLGISHATLYRLLGRGALDAVKVGAATRITAASIERYIASLPAAQVRRFPEE